MNTGKPAAPFGDYSGESGPEHDVIHRFQSIIYEFYGANGRSFSWRETSDPYAILVSEVMLQQTQTARVEPKYLEFVSRWPDFASLARAELGEVYPIWQGLGYNRRALGLIRAARMVTEQYSGRLPRNPDELVKLPGIGPATAGAICAYAFGLPVPFIETNIRRTVIHFFFESRTDVADAEIQPFVTATLDHRDPRNWFYALTDYGAYLKAALINPNRRSRAYVRQSAFEGSDRQIRGRILSELSRQGRLAGPDLYARMPFSEERLTSCLTALVEEGMVAESDGVYGLP